MHQKDINKFQVAYSSLLKGNLDGLKKLKKPKSKTKAEWWIVIKWGFLFKVECECAMHILNNLFYKLDKC